MNFTSQVVSFLVFHFCKESRLKILDLKFKGSVNDLILGVYVLIAGYWRTSRKRCKCRWFRSLIKFKLYINRVLKYCMLHLACEKVFPFAVDVCQKGFNDFGHIVWTSKIQRHAGSKLITNGLLWSPAEGGIFKRTKAKRVVEFFAEGPISRVQLPASFNQNSPIGSQI